VASKGLITSLTLPTKNKCNLENEIAMYLSFITTVFIVIFQKQDFAIIGHINFNVLSGNLNIIDLRVRVSGMKTVYFVTTNKGKVHSVSSTLSEFDIRVLHESLEIPELKYESFEEITIHKALFAWERIRKPLIVMDAGLCIPSLNDFPGPYSKYVLNKIGVEGIIKLVEDKDRCCYFKNVLGYMDSKLKEPKLFSFKIEGTIAEEPRGEMKEYSWSKYSLIFIPKGLNKTLGEMTREEYEEWRARINKRSYLIEFGEWFSKRKI